MNPLIRKEVRMLLPAWVVALVAATTPVWFGKDYSSLAAPLIIVSVFFVALAAFGQEMSLGTFSLLLVQPAERRRLWNVKALLSALALLSAWAVVAASWWVCYQSGAWAVRSNAELGKIIGWCGVLALVAYAGGIWTPLLFRDMTTAFFASVIVPALIAVVVMLRLGNWIAGCLCVYSVAGVWFGRWLFLRAQDIPWKGGEVSVSAKWSAPARMFSTGFARKGGAWSAFARKELRQQEAALFLVPWLALAHLVAIGARHFYPVSSDARFCLDAFWILWLMVPLVAGCVAVAQERRLNTHESQLCIPFSTRNQFVIKFAVAMVVGIGLGGVFPFLLENSAWAIGLGIDCSPLALLVVVLGGSTVTALISFYGSTLSVGLLPAFTTGLCMAFGVGGALEIMSYRVSSMMFSHRTIFIWMAWPAMTATFFWLAYKNYKSLRTGWPLWLGNLGAAGAVFASVALLSSGIYNRDWELFMRLEPRHGPARIAGAGRAAIGNSENVDGLAQNVDGLEVLLPDGRLWIGQRARNASLAIWGEFAPGSNWVCLAACVDGAAAIKSDGTLWNVTDAKHISQIGSDSDWKKVVADWGRFFGLKRDGTVWQWGHVTQEWPVSNPIPYVSEPARIGAESDWLDIFAAQSGDILKAVKNDGTICGLALDYHNPAIPSPRLQSEFIPWNFGLAGTNWTSLYGGPAQPFALGIRTDGTLWAYGDLPSEIFGIATKPGHHDLAVRVGDKSDWSEFSESGVHLVALESNGTVSVMRLGHFQTSHPSQHKDWIAVAAEFQDTWALAADGTVCCWEENLEEMIPYKDGRISMGPLLRVTRRPIVAINILDSK